MIAEGQTNEDNGDSRKSGNKIRMYLFLLYMYLTCNLSVNANNSTYRFTPV